MVQISLDSTEEELLIFSVKPYIRVCLPDVSCPYLPLSWVCHKWLCYIYMLLGNCLHALPTQLAADKT